MSEELKACPLCGGRAYFNQTGKYELTLKCEICRFGCTQKVIRFSLDWLKLRMQHAWNNRISKP